MRVRLIPGCDVCCICCIVGFSYKTIFFLRLYQTLLSRPDCHSSLRSESLVSSEWQPDSSTMFDRHYVITGVSSCGRVAWMYTSSRVWLTGWSSRMGMAAPTRGGGRGSCVGAGGGIRLCVLA